jgi:hypothetical protein
MKVKELIKQLEQMPQDMNIALFRKKAPTDEVNTITLEEVVKKPIEQINFETEFEDFNVRVINHNDENYSVAIDFENDEEIVVLM